MTRSTPLVIFLHRLTDTERKTVKDEKKLHGAVDKSTSKQHFRKLDTITFVV